MADERKKALELAVAEIEKQFGKGSIMKLGDAPVSDMATIPTGSLALDIAIGVGGIPRGRVIEIYGPESSGKTTLCLSIVAQAQKAGGIAAYIDAEHAMDSEYARKVGVDVDNLLISQPESGEQALQIVETLVRSSALDVIVVDSVAALVPRSEIDGDMGDPQMGMQARLMSQALRKLTAVMSKTNTSVIFINQLREKIGVMFGNPETTPGGKALKFYASVRIDIRRVESIKNGTEVIGNRVKAKVVKNKVAPPFREGQFDIMFGEGINREGSILDMAVDHGIVEKAGTWFSYKADRLGQGRDAVRVFLKENPALAQEIDDLVRAKLAAKPAEATPSTAAEILEKKEPAKPVKK
jgi:recombination protein RecA